MKVRVTLEVEDLDTVWKDLSDLSAQDRAIKCGLEFAQVINDHRPLLGPVVFLHQVFYETSDEEREKMGESCTLTFYRPE